MVAKNGSNQLTSAAKNQDINIDDDNGNTAAENDAARAGQTQQQRPTTKGARIGAHRVAEDGNRRHTSCDKGAKAMNGYDLQQAREVRPWKGQSELLTLEQFEAAIEGKMRVPSQLLPWTHEFSHRFGSWGKEQYENVDELMQKYTKAMRARHKEKLKEDDELREHLRQCKATWRRQRRKEQGKKTRGSRGQGEQRKATRAAARASKREQKISAATHPTTQEKEKLLLAWALLRRDVSE